MNRSILLRPFGPRTLYRHFYLKKRHKKIGSLPYFEESQHIPVASSEEFRRRESAEARRLIWYHTRIHSPWWGAGLNPSRPRPLYVKKTQRNIPEGTIPLEEGAKVIDASGNPVGGVEEVYAEPEEHRVTHILISQGTLLTEKKLIPTLWVDTVLEDEIRLSVESDLIKDLPVHNTDTAME